MANREKVPSVMWTAGGSFQRGRYWVAVFANEGAERLAGYIKTLREEWVKETERAEREEIARIGKHAVAVYRKHFGEI